LTKSEGFVFTKQKTIINYFENKLFDPFYSPKRKGHAFTEMLIEFTEF